MIKNLPGKKVIVVAVVAALLLVWSIIYSNKPGKEHFITSFLKNITQSESSFADSDNDGLEDWEEKLFKTDILNIDSNSDGVGDYEELVNSKYIKYSEPSDSIFNYINTNNTPSEDQSSTQNLTLEPTFYTDEYTASDVTIINTDETTVTKYIASVLIVLVEDTDNLEKEPLVIINDWLEEYDDANLQELVLISNANKNIANKLMALEVPDELVSLHLNMTNSLYLSARSLDDVKFATQDPTAGFFAAASYANYRSKFAQTILSLTQYYNE